MTDRKSKYPGRFKIVYVEQGDGYVVADIVRADEPEDEGTLLAKRTILPDSVARALGLIPETATPAEAFAVLAENVPQEISQIIVTEYDDATKIEFGNSNSTKNIVESTFDAENRLASLKVDGRSVSVIWSQSGGVEIG